MWKGKNTFTTETHGTARIKAGKLGGKANSEVGMRNVEIEMNKIISSRP
jgi:hypothetical protein